MGKINLLLWDIKSGWSFPSVSCLPTQIVPVTRGIENEKHKKKHLYILKTGFEFSFVTVAFDYTFRFPVSVQRVFISFWTTPQRSRTEMQRRVSFIRSLKSCERGAVVCLRKCKRLNSSPVISVQLTSRRYAVLNLLSRLISDHQLSSSLPCIQIPSVSTFFFLSCKNYLCTDLKALNCFPVHVLREH